MNAVIVSGGTCPSAELIEKEVKKDSIVICADSGADCLCRYNIIPKYLIGDFDSIDEEVLSFFQGNNSCIIERYPKDKDFTDTELAVQKALSLGADNIIFLGCTGSRLDHVLGNLGLMKKCIDKGVSSVIKDEHNEITLMNKPNDIHGVPGQYFSLQCYGSMVKNLSVTGAKFELKGYDLLIGDPLTISNEFLYDTVHIEFDDGILMVLYCRD